jgi:protein required for attachment to host cells
MANNKTWLLIANASKARIYALYKARVFQEHHPKHLKLIGEYDHLESRKKGIELATDKQGGYGSGTFVEATGPKEHEAEQFAHELLGYLEVGRKKGIFRDLIIVAPPSFMGMIQKDMPEEIHKLVSQRIEKDYTQMNEQELMQNLINHF